MPSSGPPWSRSAWPRPYGTRRCAGCCQYLSSYATKLAAQLHLRHGGACCVACTTRGRGTEEGWHGSQHTGADRGILSAMQVTAGYSHSQAEHATAHTNSSDSCRWHVHFRLCIFTAPVLACCSPPMLSAFTKSLVHSCYHGPEHVRTDCLSTPASLLGATLEVREWCQLLSLLCSLVRACHSNICRKREPGNLARPGAYMA